MRRFLAFSAIGALVCVTAACGGGEGDWGDEDGGLRTGVYTQDDADRVGIIISSQWDQAVPTFDSPGWVYTVHPVAGYYQGQVVLDGTYEHWWSGLDKNYRYTDMTFQYSDYQEDADMSSLTGSAAATGQIRWDDSSRRHSGSWQVQGSVQLNAPSSPSLTRFQYQCAVDFAFLFVSPYGEYVGKIFFEGTEWDIDSSF